MFKISKIKYSIIVRLFSYIQKKPVFVQISAKYFLVYIYFFSQDWIELFVGHGPGLEDANE